MTRKICGSCACGKISYVARSEVRFSLICHCRQCQRITGTGHAAQFAVSASDTDLEGHLQFYELTADSGGTVTSGFCAECGSPVLKKTTSMPDVFFIHAATLDDPSQFKPDMVVFKQAAPPWDHVDPAIPAKA